MNKLTSIKNARNIIIGVYFIFVLGLSAWCTAAYHDAKEALQGLDVQNNKLANLDKEIEISKNSVDQLKEEQEEFKKLLFNERDVPSFIDGLSHSAKQSSVLIMDMKTQRFSQIIVPKEMRSANSLEVKRSYDDFDDDKKPDRSADLQNTLTLASMPIHIKIHGAFDAIIHFLNFVENYRQLLTISNVEIQRDRSYPQLDCNFILKIYSLENLKDLSL